MTALSEAIPAVANALNDWALATVSANTAGTSLTAAWLQSADTTASANRFDGAWIYGVSGTCAGQVQRVVRGGYARATGVLTLEVSIATTFAINDVIAITRLFPVIPVTGYQETDYRAMVNAALGHLLIPWRLAITTVANQPTYTLTPTWLDRDERIDRSQSKNGLFEPALSAADHLRPAWRREATVRFGGSTPILEVTPAWSTASALAELAVFRPANTLINGADGTALTAWADTTRADLEHVREAALVEAYRVLDGRGTTRGGDWHRKYVEQLARARRLRWWDRTADTSPAAEARAPAASADPRAALAAAAEAAA